jgi:hypothetical protein
MIFQWATRLAGKANIFLPAAILMLSAAHLSAQAPKQITLPRQSMTVSQLFREIERQTGYVVVVRSNKVDDGKTVALSGMSGSLDEILNHVFTDTNNSWQASGGYITIDAKEPAQPQPQLPITIAEDELRQFAPEARRSTDSIVIRKVEAGPFRFEAGDKTFGAPGRQIDGAIVSEPFSTAERRQRSKFALKANLLYGLATLTPNLRTELGFGNHSTMELGAAYNGINLKGTPENNKKSVHGIALAEYRYWLCERFSGHFLGVHGFGGFYNVGGRNIPMLFKKEFRYEGTAYGGGISYGYMLPLSTRWGVEFNVGVGVAQLRYDKYGCDKCDELEGKYSKTYFGPTRAAVNLVFIIK